MISQVSVERDHAEYRTAQYPEVPLVLVYGARLPDQLTVRPHCVPRVLKYQTPHANFSKVPSPSCFKSKNHMLSGSGQPRVWWEFRTLTAPIWDHTSPGNVWMGKIVLRSCQGPSADFRSTPHALQGNSQEGEFIFHILIKLHLCSSKMHCKRIPVHS